MPPLPQKHTGNPLKKLLAQGVVWRPAGGPSADFKATPAACFGISAIDELLPYHGLPFGQLHEWSLDDGLSAPNRRRNHKSWHPPLTILTSLLGTSISAQESGELLASLDKRLIVWIGRSCWPTPHLLRAATQEAAWNWKQNCLFLDPPGREKRLWALIQALRSPAVFAVVGDVSRLEGVALRRMQLAAEHGRTLGLLIRPSWENSTLSSTYSKWRVRPLPSTAPLSKNSLSKKRSEKPKGIKLSANMMQWSLELMRLRGSLKSTAIASSDAIRPREDQVLGQWLLAWKTDHGKGSLSLIEAPEAVELAREDAGAA